MVKRAGLRIATADGSIQDSKSATVARRCDGAVSLPWIVPLVKHLSALPRRLPLNIGKPIPPELEDN